MNECVHRSQANVLDFDRDFSKRKSNLLKISTMKNSRHLPDNVQALSFSGSNSCSWWRISSGLGVCNRRSRCRSLEESNKNMYGKCRSYYSSEEMLFFWSKSIISNQRVRSSSDIIPPLTNGQKTSRNSTQLINGSIKQSFEQWKKSKNFYQRFVSVWNTIQWITADHDWKYEYYYELIHWSIAWIMMISYNLIVDCRNQHLFAERFDWVLNERKEIILTDRRRRFSYGWFHCWFS